MVIYYMISKTDRYRPVRCRHTMIDAIDNLICWKRANPPLKFLCKALFDSCRFMEGGWCYVRHCIDQHLKS